MDKAESARGQSGLEFPAARGPKRIRGLSLSAVLGLVQVLSDVTDRHEAAWVRVAKPKRCKPTARKACQ